MSVRKNCILSVIFFADSHPCTSNNDTPVLSNSGTSSPRLCPLLIHEEHVGAVRFQITTFSFVHVTISAGTAGCDSDQVQIMGPPYDCSARHQTTTYRVTSVTQTYSLWISIPQTPWKKKKPMRWILFGASSQAPIDLEWKTEPTEWDKDKNRNEFRADLKGWSFAGADSAPLYHLKVTILHPEPFSLTVYSQWNHRLRAVPKKTRIYRLSQLLFWQMFTEVINLMRSPFWGFCTPTAFRMMQI